MLFGIAVFKFRYSDEKYTKVIKARTEQGLYYDDDLFPGDEDERWYFMKKGEEVNRKDTVRERTQLEAKANVDPQLRAALTDQDEGLLRAGNLPQVTTATKEGSKALLDRLEKAGGQADIYHASISIR